MQRFNVLRQHFCISTPFRPCFQSVKSFINKWCNSNLILNILLFYIYLSTFSFNFLCTPSIDLVQDGNVKRLWVPSSFPQSFAQHTFLFLGCIWTDLAYECSLWATIAILHGLLKLIFLLKLRNMWCEAALKPQIKSNAIMHMVFPIPLLLHPFPAT